MASYKHILSKIFSLVTLLGSPLFYIPLILILFVLGSHLTVKLLFSLIFIEILCIAIKLVYKKERPIPQSREGLYNKIDANSFPSVHSARIALLATVVVFNCKSILSTICIIVIAVAVGYSRIYLKRHDIKDVLVGFFIGILAGIIAFYI